MDTNLIIKHQTWWQIVNWVSVIIQNLRFISTKLIARYSFLLIDKDLESVHYVLIYNIDSKAYPQLAQLYVIL